MLIATFIEMAMGKVSSGKFLAQHQEWLLGFDRVRPVMVAWGRGELLPTPALHKILAILPREKDKSPPVKVASAPKGKTALVKEGKAPKAEVEKTPRQVRVYTYTVTICLPTGIGAVLADSFGADTYQEAQQKAFNRLIRMPSDAWAEIAGLGATTRVERNATFGGGRSAFQAIYGKRLGGSQSCRGTGRMNAELNSKMSVHNDTCHFSRG